MAKDGDFAVIYSNLVRITHGGLEFFLDFKQLSPENKDLETAPTQVRLVLHPAIAKGLRDALADNIARYEQQFGEMPTPPKGPAPPMH